MVYLKTPLQNFLAARSQSTTMARAVSSYRAGYTPAERREIEARLASGDLLAVVSTSALELGIDIGELDLCLLVGYPGTRIATHQRAGRVGRRSKAAAVILIAGQDALDAYFLKHPDQLWQGETDSAAIFIYDGIPGGAGLCREAFDHFKTLVRQAITTAEDCQCETGCPACVHSPKCGSGNEPLDKSGARHLLEGLLTRHPDSAIHRPDLPANTARQTAAPKKALTRYGVLDLETRRSAEEVGGWQFAHRMGISCAVLYESAADRFGVFWEDELDALLARLADLELVVGFNLLRFDYQVLLPYLPGGWQWPRTLDILDQVHQCLGYRRSLAHLAEETLGATKSADGLTALRWWRQGRHEEVAAYCRQDVALTRDLYLYGRQKGFLLYRDGEGQRMEVPVDFVNA
jgi:hypothetical protein